MSYEWILLFSQDNMISVHDLTVFNLPLLLAMPQTKGATAFDLDIKVSVPCPVYLLVACVMTAVILFQGFQNWKLTYFFYFLSHRMGWFLYR